MTALTYACAVARGLRRVLALATRALEHAPVRWQLTEDATVVVGRLLFARAHIAWFELHTVCVKAFGAPHHHALVAAWRAALGAVGACGPVLRLFACHLLS